MALEQLSADTDRQNAPALTSSTQGGRAGGMQMPARAGAQSLVPNEVRAARSSALAAPSGFGPRPLGCLRPIERRSARRRPLVPLARRSRGRRAH
jgi:hypothetical protein